MGAPGYQLLSSNHFVYVILRPGHFCLLYPKVSPEQSMTKAQHKHSLKQARMQIAAMMFVE